MFMPRTRATDEADKKRRHLSLLRSIVQRMFVGSYLVRLWSALIVGALTAVAAMPDYVRFRWLALAMAIGFWMLDAHLCRQRNLYEKTHRRVREQSGPEVDYSLDTSPVDNEGDSFVSRMFAPGLAAFYVTLSAAAGVALWLFNGRGS